jgi:hypothetical protein
MSRAERVASVMIVFGLLGGVSSVGAVMVARGHGLVLAVFVVALVAGVALVYFAKSRRR